MICRRPGPSSCIGHPLRHRLSGVRIDRIKENRANAVLWKGFSLLMGEEEHRIQTQTVRHVGTQIYPAIIPEKLLFSPPTIPSWVK